MVANSFHSYWQSFWAVDELRLRPLELVLGHQFILLALVTLHTMGFFIPVLTPVVALIGLTLVPGYLFLSILELDDQVSPTVIAFLTIAMSLILVIVFGFVANIVYLRIGVSEPITPVPLATAIVVGSTLLYAVNRSFDRPGLTVTVDVEPTEYPIALSFILLPFLGTFGAYLLDNFSENAFLIALFVLISVLPIVFLSYLPQKYYWLGILSISLTLLLAITLSYNHLGSGIEYEEMFIIVQNGH